MPISFKHKALFVHIPKTGGQSVSEMLGINKGSLKNYYGHEVKVGQTLHQGLGLTHLTIAQIKERMNTEGFYIFAFVRNPYERISSEYHWRMRNISVFKEPTGHHVGFVYYCELLRERWEYIMSNDNLTTKRITDRQHVIPQSHYVDSDVNIYRHEQFEKECLKIQKILGLNRSVPKVNAYPHKTQHTDKTIEITNELYKSDFEQFNYEMK